MELMDRKTRAIAPVVGTILLVAVVIILAATIGGVALGFGDELGEPSPAVVFSVEQDNETVQAVHGGGTVLDRANLAVEDGTIVDAPTRVGAGDRVVIVPEPGTDELAITWDGSGRSTILTTAAIDPISTPPETPQPEGGSDLVGLTNEGDSLVEGSTLSTADQVTITNPEDSPIEVVIEDFFSTTTTTVEAGSEDTVDVPGLFVDREITSIEDNPEEDTVAVDLGFDFF